MTFGDKGSGVADYDLVVIGGGAGGMGAARTAIRRRARVALVQDGPIGGDCTFVGCVPSKTLIESAAQGDDFVTAMGRVTKAVGDIAATETAAVLRKEGIVVIEGAARLLSSRRVSVNDVELRARKLVIATGTSPLIPPIPGLTELDVLTNETVFDLGERPASLLVIGGGSIGVELAQAFARLGTAVTIVEAADRLLSREEPDASAIVAATLGADGVKVITGREIVGARGGPGGARLALDDGSEVHGSRVLVAVGRAPVTADLDLAVAGVALDQRGFIVTDDHLRSSVGNIWAAGDIAGKVQLTHAADEMGRIAANNALSKVAYRRFRAHQVPAVTFTDPEVAHVGVTEAAAADIQGARVAFLPMSEVDRAIAAGRTEGFVKLLVGPRRVTRNLAGGRLLGATVVAPRAGEMIHEPALIMRSDMFPARLALTVHAYPTWSLAIRQAASQLFVETGGRRARAPRS
ncbi:MAG: FAD-dependent oxidoreductase [Actinomycetota bacterium]|nr:FAD-dependent oxidoreductase [Actinomycetota bacterium]